MSDSYSRHVDFDFVQNCRDLGGYRTRDGRNVAWRRLFRSGELRHTGPADLARLREEISLASVIDLRSGGEIRKHSIELLSEAGIRYHNVPFLTGGGGPGSDGDLFPRFTNMGQFYTFLLNDEQFGKRLVGALEIIADPQNHPLLFHCTIGKDRTGVLAAIVLSVLGVGDDDIIEDYALTAPHMVGFIERMKKIPEAAEMVTNLPAYFWEASRESMDLFLSTLRRDYGSVRGYIEAQEIEPSLLDRLESALLAD